MTKVEKTRAEIIVMNIRNKSIDRAGETLDVPSEVLINVMYVLRDTTPKHVIPIKYSKQGLSRTLIAKYGRVKAHIIARGMYGYAIIDETDLD